MCSTATKALLLTTYFKWLNLFPEIREQIVSVFVRYSHVLDAELQQRACEYLAIARRPDDDLLQVVVDEMPPYPERESAVSPSSAFHSRHVSDFIMPTAPESTVEEDG
jgi:AP-2 complex subunit alpha